MNNKKTILTLILILASLIFYLNSNFSLSSLIIIWITILIYLIRKIKNHFINLLLILEILSLRRIFMIRNLSQVINSTRLIFILITLRVGEAVLGLAILVKLVRWSSTEFIITGLN